MGKLQYRALILTFIVFIVAMIVLSLSVHLTMGDLIRADIKSSLDATHTYKRQYLKSWTNSEKESFDDLYIGPELINSIFEFVKQPALSESDYVAHLNEIRQTLADKMSEDATAELSVVAPDGNVYISSNLELLNHAHPFWRSHQYAPRDPMNTETRAYVQMADTLNVTLIRELYFQGALFAFLVLEKPIPEQFFFNLVHSQLGNYQVLLYDRSGQAYLFLQQQSPRQFQFNVTDSFTTAKNYWLESSGWSPLNNNSMVGVWGWDTQLNLGVAVIAESRSVFKVLRIAQSINAGFIFCVIAASLIIAWFFREYRKHRLYLEHQLENALEVQARDLNNERREKQTLVEALFQNSSDGYLVVTPTQVLECNPASLAMLEVDESSSLVGRPPFLFSPPFQADGEVSLEKSEALLAEAFATGFKRFEWQFETRSRSRLYCWVTITIVKYYGEMVGIMVWQNMTKAIESEKVLRDSERKSRAILNATNHILFVLDPQGFVVDLNSAAEDWLGESRDELLGLSYWDVANWLIDSQLMALIKDAFDTALSGQVARFEADLKIADEKHFLDFVLTPIQDESYELVMVILEAYDISQIRHAEIAQKEARKLAEEVSQTKTNFLANMSHEIRTPMNAIMGLTKLCLKTQLNGRQRTMLESIDQASETLLNILNDILDFAKVESGKLEIDLVTFAIEDVLQTVAGLFSLKAEEKGLEFIVSNKASDFRLIGDPLRIQQVLMNLCSNAIKFTQQGEVVLTVEPIEQSHDRGLFRFSVKDSGVGLSPEQQEKLFEAFSQADSSTTRQFGGTGLGLAICKELIELMGGEISVQSEMGKGSHFYFDLPLALLDDSEDPFSKVDLNTHRHIAIVDDNVVCIEVEKKIVNKLGYRVSVFGSAEDLLQCLEQREAHFDVVLMDWDMPGMDGCEASLKLKQSLGSNAPSVILVTGVRNEISPEQMAQFGLDGFVIKPVNPDVLSHVIDDALEKGARRADQPQSAAASEENLLPPVRVLVVEDNDINQMVVRNFLIETGVEPIVVANGQEAVDFVLQQNEPLAAVLMDLQMPVMDGFTATEIIRQHYDENTLPIIAMTANVLTSDRERAKDLGMNDIISKPIDFEAFEWILGQWLTLPKSFVDKQTEEVTDLSSIVAEGIDFEFGLKQLGNDEALYLSLLQKFREEFVEAIEDLEHSVDIDARDMVEEISHRMKGVAGNLGFYDLSDRLKEIEDSSAVGEDVTQAVMQVQEQWIGLNEAINDAVSVLESKASTSPQTIANEELIRYLNEVADRLDRHEVLPMDEVRHLRVLLLKQVDEGSVNRFIRCIESFKMEEAMELLVAFVEQLLESDKN